MIPRVRLIEFHPLADIIPPMEGTEFDELVADIKAHGLREPIDLYEGQILDGRNRYRAALAAGMSNEIQHHIINLDTYFDNDAAARAHVISKNLHRRHLTAELRRDLLVKLVAAQPEKSDRVIAAAAKVDHHQVARARKKGVATGTIVPVEKRVGKDGKARKQPAKKKRPPADKRDIAAKKAAVAADLQAKTVHDPIAPDEELLLLREFAQWFVSERARVAYDAKDRDEFRALFSRVKAVLGGA
jgi:ParB-like chromosome segregation protein Spo0J